MCGRIISYNGDVVVDDDEAVDVDDDDDDEQYVCLAVSFPSKSFPDLWINFSPSNFDNFFDQIMS